MRSWLKRVALAAASLALLATAGCDKYAVLISTNDVVADDVSIHSEWWYDLFLQYQALRDLGFKDENIYVLYGNGTDFDTKYDDYNATKVFGHPITDRAVSKANIAQVFTDLNPIVDSRDHLYVWWMGHGGGSGTGQCDLSMLISNTGEFVSDTELAAYINTVAHYKKRTISVMTCHSGGMIDNMNAAARTVTLTSSTCVQSSYDAAATCNGRVHADFNYTEPNGLRQQNPCGAAVASDANGNGRVSLSEVHQYDAAAMTTSTPQMTDPAGIAASTELGKSQP